jgi:CubicO group peptidase (beta-lactamase class C family)
MGSRSPSDAARATAWTSSAETTRSTTSQRAASPAAFSTSTTSRGHGGFAGRGTTTSPCSPAIELMTTDQLTPEQKALSPFFPGFWDARGWGLGLSVVTRRSELGRGPGSYGWDGAFSTSFSVDPSEDLVGVLMTQRSPDVLDMPLVARDFWAATYQAFDD